MKMKWKRKGTETVFVAVCAVVLIASYGIGLCIREIRFRRAAAALAESETKKTSVINQEVTNTPAGGPMPEGRVPGNDRSFTGEERPRLREGRPDRMGRFGDMSEEEREQMRERFPGGRRGGGRFENLSDEEIAEMEERRRQMRERMENMTEEERAEFMAQMRERFGGRRRAGGPDSERQEND
jgi:hypothetical protein